MATITCQHCERENEMPDDELLTLAKQRRSRRFKNRIRHGGCIFTETKAKKEFRCEVCPIPIHPGEDYLKVEFAGAGVSSTVRPDRIHNNQNEIALYLEKYGSIY